ncbi:capsule-associated protein CAP1 [Loxospora ochrophaea]|nr:capsule-associated protein CAP1 [Loxospora ochrophaea]
MRPRQLGTLLALCAFAGFSILLLRRSPTPSIPIVIPSSSRSSTKNAPPLDDAPPLAPPSVDSHPIHQLIAQADKEFTDLQARQSKSLEEAVAEYKRRYKIPPPPNFDKWFEYAQMKDVQLIDEYDTIYHSLLPFWALDPSTIRARASEALGFDNFLLGLLIRDGQVVSVTGGDEWQQKSTVGMIKYFVKYLPNMDVPFNTHDEPRVIVPYEDLNRLVTKAIEQTMPAALGNKSPKNNFSPRPADMDDGTRYNEVKTTRFNRFAHQPTWTHSRLSCSPDSPARALDDSTPDNMTSYAFSPLGFISNKTAFSDICLSPSLRETFGFFDRPNAFDIVHDLFPIFSQSKISSFQDILYPSPWYWSDKVPYDNKKDYAWAKKKNKMWWRGSTTGGFSRNGGWRRQHRQKFVQKINSPDQARIFENQSSLISEKWQETSVPRSSLKDLFDVKFSHIGQCDPGDCDAQREFFEVVKPADQQEAWAYKYLLDIDGNAFSGRFYAFLKSTSLVYKMAIFREWHEEWIRPWVHYIPLGMKGDEYAESVRYFDREEGGRAQGVRVATQGREWAGKVLRQSDLEVWFFRLLLE